MIHYSGQNFYMRPSGYAPTISVIEKPTESYAEHHERKSREEGARRVPFGFSRALAAGPSNLAKPKPRIWTET
jgi:hypothetical protein